MRWNGIWRIAKAMPGVKVFARSRRGQALRHRWALHFEDRQGFTFTQFSRSPGQIDALCGPVLDFIGAIPRTKPLRLLVLGCSSGAEPYTVASELLRRHPGLDFTIDAFDISGDVLATARRAAYPAAWVEGHTLITPEFVARTFDRDGDTLTVKQRVAERVSFAGADVTSRSFRTRTPSADVVFAQNLMCNARRPVAREILRTAIALLKPRAALFVDGADLDIRARLTRRGGLRPLTVDLERIHGDARRVRGDRYPWFAAGLEPFDASRRDRDRRYATIFLRDGGTPAEALRQP